MAEHAPAPKKIFISAASNVGPSALAVLRKLGYAVSYVDAHLLQATKAGCVLLADDPILLLGLAKLAEERGASWRPTAAEIYAAMDLESSR